MKLIYAIPDNNAPTKYFNTRHEARSYWRSQEEPERIESIDPAKTCEYLTETLDSLETQNIALAVALRGIIATVGNEYLRDCQEGREALRLMRKIDPAFVLDCGL